MPQASTPTNAAIRCEARTETSSRGAPSATAVASSRMAECSSETRVSRVRPAITAIASAPNERTVLTASAMGLAALACAS
jgi:hypothetical protein